MASKFNDSGTPSRPPSSSVGSSLDSGSDGFDRSSPLYRDDSSSRESSPCPFEVIYDIDLKQYRKEVPFQSHEADSSTAFPAETSLNENATSQPSLSCGGSQYVQGNAVSHPLSLNLNLFTGHSASGDINVDDDEMDDDGFWAQFESRPPAQVDQDHGAGSGARGDDMMEMLEEDLEAQLDAELEAEARREELVPTDEEAVEAARRKANLDEALRIAAEKAALVVQYDHDDDLSFPTEEELEAELRATEAAGEPFGDIDDMIAGLEPGINASTVNLKTRHRNKSAKKRAKKPKSQPQVEPQAVPKPRPATGAPRVASAQPPPMRRTEELPRLYHQSGTDWKVLRKHMALSTRVELKQCYRALGLDVNRGKAVYDSLKAYLRIPGNSINFSADNFDPDEAKRTIAELSHKLLYDLRWGDTYFNRPSLESGCKTITYSGDSTEIFLEFSSLLYKAMKLEEKRKKGKDKNQEHKDARAAMQHHTSEAFPFTTYLSPRSLEAPAALQNGPPQTTHHQTIPQQPGHKQTTHNHKDNQQNGFQQNNMHNNHQQNSLQQTSRQELNNNQQNIFQDRGLLELPAPLHPAVIAFLRMQGKQV